MCYDRLSFAFLSGRPVPAPPWPTMATRLLNNCIVGTSFSFFTDEEVRRLSVKRVTNPMTFDAHNHPLPG